MKTETQNQVIGELCGMKWYVVSNPIRSAKRFLFWPEMITGNEGIVPASMEEPIAPVGWDWFKYLANYTECLNAMHEAEKHLTAEEWPTYRNTLALMCGGASEEDGASFVQLGVAISAEANQRAEAFVRVKGKWSVE